MSQVSHVNNLIYAEKFDFNTLATASVEKINSNFKHFECLHDQNYEND